MEDTRSTHLGFRAFENVCVCRGNFAGARCDLCRPGFLLPDCVRPARPRVRKDWAKLLEQERQDVMAAFNYMKVSSIYLGYATEGGLLLSDYDAFTYMHSRSVYNVSLGCTEDCSYAHLGPGFATWHRRLLIFFETIFLAYLPVESSVAGLPFLNWPFFRACTTFSPHNTSAATQETHLWCLHIKSSMVSLPCGAIWQEMAVCSQQESSATTMSMRSRTCPPGCTFVRLCILTSMPGCVSLVITLLKYELCQPPGGKSA